MMWAHRIVAPSRLERVDVADLGESAVYPGAVLLRTLAGGICGSDAPKFRGDKLASVGGDGRFRPGRPGFPLHEVVGEVVATRDPRHAIGSRVVGWATASNGLAEYVVTDGAQVHRYDPSLPPKVAVLIQSLACVLYAAQQFEVAGRRVAVLGMGPIGLMFAHVFKGRGAARITGVDPVDRSAVASALGVDEAVRGGSGAWVRSLDPADRPHLTVECVGHQISTLAHAIDATEVGGTVLYFGIPDDEVYPLNMESLMRKNLTLVGGITRDRARWLAEAEAYLLRHPELYDRLVTHEFGAGDAQHAFDTAFGGSPGARLKVVIEMV